MTSKLDQGKELDKDKFDKLRDKDDSRENIDLGVDLQVIDKYLPLLEMLYENRK